MAWGPGVGTMLVIQPMAVLLAAPVFVGVILLTRYVSLGSLLGSAAMFPAMLLVLLVVPETPLPYVHLLGGRGRADLAGPRRQHRPADPRHGAQVRPGAARREAARYRLEPRASAAGVEPTARACSQGASAREMRERPSGTSTQAVVPSERPMLGVETNDPGRLTTRVGITLVRRAVGRPAPRGSGQPPRMLRKQSLQ